MWILFIAICVLYSTVSVQGEEEPGDDPDGNATLVQPEEEKDLTGPLTPEVIKKLNTPIKIPDDLVEVEELDKDTDGGDDSDGEGNTETQGINTEKGKMKKKRDSDESPEVKRGSLYHKDMMAGDMGDLAGANKHRFVPRIYADFSRRSANIGRDGDLDKAAEEKLHQAIQIAQEEVAQDDKLRPVKADPKLVMDVALQSARLEASKPINPAEVIINANVMRSGNYWNSVWKEDVPNPSRVLRSHKKRHRKPSRNKLEAVRVKIMPGSKLYELVALTKRISPKLLYIMNQK